MRKDSHYNFWIAAGLLASAFSLFLTPEAAAIKLPMPDIKGQFNKQNLKGSSQQVTMQADQVSFSTADNKAHAVGNVVVTSKDQQLFCDKLDLDRAVNEAVAEGNVFLDTPQENVVAEGLTYNFNDRTGEFRNATVYISPYQIKGQKIEKISEDHMAMDEGYMTTCDLDEPHYRIGAHRMDIYQKDKAMIHGMKVYLGHMPVMYLPYFEQDLKNRPLVTFVPGDKKDFGLFLLATARFDAGRYVKMTVHADVRERDGFGEGFDARYNTPGFGAGLLSAYYTDENHIASSHLWNLYRNGVKKGPTTHHERYRIVWRHHWRIDQNTDAVVQYYKIHDFDILNNGFLKTYFPRDYLQNAQSSNLDSYFLLTRNMPHGTLIFNVETSRVNRPLRGIERIPEVRYILNNEQIAKSGFYVKSTDTFSDLSQQNYPKTFNRKTLRLDSNNDVSHPFKVGFISFNPHLGGEETYYTRTLDVNRNDLIRGIFRGSLDMSSKFYKVWDVHTDFAGLNINNLRHVITPTVTYLYQGRPTHSSILLNQFDSNIDELFRIHQFEFGLENKLQTKRNGQVVDLLRVLISTNYGLKGTTVGSPAQTSGLGATGRKGFNPYDTAIDFNPTDWLTLHDDNEYDSKLGQVNSHNFDAVVHGTDWSVALGNRYALDQGDQVTGEVNFRLNPKWKFRVYGTFPVTKASNGNTTSAREYAYVITRDLHEWEMDVGIDQQQGQGSLIYVLFRLKAFPNMKFNLLNTTFHSSRPGTLSQTGENQ